MFSLTPSDDAASRRFASGRMSLNVKELPSGAVTPDTAAAPSTPKLTEVGPVVTVASEGSVPVVPKLVVTPESAGTKRLALGFSRRSSGTIAPEDWSRTFAVPA
ncbi:hypothetical protein [Fodinicola feengrottensis]|uniref:hypothetical protein n=1 Tax=Fodinicola feengrottensis TaxID=435914 RepID=UPI0013D5062A|nr:hypothetical protein [Fodinicola feengrottensis]